MALNTIVGMFILKCTLIWHPPGSRKSKCTSPCVVHLCYLYIEYKIKVKEWTRLLKREGEGVCGVIETRARLGTGKGVRRDTEKR